MLLIKRLPILKARIPVEIVRKVHIGFGAVIKEK
jgi:hypothetical protein